jgi:hypothetical protein
MRFIRQVLHVSLDTWSLARPSHTRVVDGPAGLLFHDIQPRQPIEPDRDIQALHAPEANVLGLHFIFLLPLFSCHTTLVRA